MRVASAGDGAAGSMRRINPTNTNTNEWPASLCLASHGPRSKQTPQGTTHLAVGGADGQNCRGDGPDPPEEGHEGRPMLAQAARVRWVVTVVLVSEAPHTQEQPQPIALCARRAALTYVRQQQPIEPLTGTDD